MFLTMRELTPQYWLSQHNTGTFQNHHHGLGITTGTWTWILKTTGLFPTAGHCFTGEQTPYHFGPADYTSAFVHFCSATLSGYHSQSEPVMTTAYLGNRQSWRKNTDLSPWGR